MNHSDREYDVKRKIGNFQQSISMFLLTLPLTPLLNLLLMCYRLSPSDAECSAEKTTQGEVDEPFFLNSSDKIIAVLLYRLGNKQKTINAQMLMAFQ